MFDEFTSLVAAWFRRSGVAEAYDWTRHERPLRNAQPPLDRAIELFTGRSMAALQGLLGAHSFETLLDALKLDQSARTPFASPHCQILRDLQPRLSDEMGALLREVGDRATRAVVGARANWHEARRVALDAARSAQSPEEAGQLAATEIRRALSLDERPIEDVPATLAQLGLEYKHTHVKNRADRMMVACREDRAVIACTLETPRTAWRWGQRFEASRALGHVLLDPIREGAIGAASGPFAGDSRRRRSGAFAAELLLPEGAIAHASEGRLDGAADDRVFPDLLQRYGIGASAAAHQMMNRGWLSSADVRDDLVERFGAGRSS